MRSTYTIDPAAGGQLITEYAGTFPGGLTVINTGQNTVYLGDDSGVSPTNGIPLTPGMATRWSAQFLYAAAALVTSILITDSASNPLTTNLPLAPPTDVWSWPAGPFPNAAPYTLPGTDTGTQLNPASGVQCAYSLPLTTPSSRTITLAMVARLSGAVTNLATITVPAGANQTFTGLVTGITIPFGGYDLEFTGTVNLSSLSFTADGAVTLVHAS